MSRKIYILIFFFMLISVGVLFLVSQRKWVSISEKRKLATFPDFTWDNYISGKFADSINQYINDHFPYREEAVKLTGTFRDNLGFRLKDMVKEVVINKKDKIDLDSVKSDPVDKVWLEDFEEAFLGSMVIMNGRVYTLNTGSPSMSPYFAKMLNEYADTLNEKTRVFSCVVPLSSAFIPNAQYEKYSKRNEETLNAIRESLSPKVYYSDIFNEMNRHYNENIWFGSDHHWTALGAYYGYVAFCKSAGLTPVPLNLMGVKKKYPFLGSLYELTRDKSVRDNPDTVIMYLPPNVETESLKYNPYDFKYPQKTKVFCNCGNYTAFICGDAPLIKITTSVKNGKKAAVVKNSMGNAFVVYLISHYEEIYVFDFRYSKHNILKIINNSNIDDLIFSLGMYGAMSRGTISMMRNLARHTPKDYDKVREREAEKRALDSLSSVQDSLQL